MILDGCSIVIGARQLGKALARTFPVADIRENPVCLLKYDLSV